MSGSKIALKAAAIAGIVTAVVLCIVALGHALFAYLTDELSLTSASAALILAFVMALLALVLGWLTFRKPFKAEEEPESMSQRVIGLAKERPILAAAAGLAAGFIFLRNPALATIVAAALTGGAHDSGKRNR